MKNNMVLPSIILTLYVGSFFCNNIFYEIPCESMLLRNNGITILVLNNCVLSSSSSSNLNAPIWKGQRYISCATQLINWLSSFLNVSCQRTLMNVIWRISLFLNLERDTSYTIGIRIIQCHLRKCECFCRINSILKE